MSAKLEFDPEFSQGIPKAKSKSRRRLRLVDLLAALAICAVLIAFLLPFNRSAGPAARRAQCTNNLKQILLALHNYEQEHNALPPAHTVDASGLPLHSWRTLILPYLEQEALYRSIDLSKSWNDPSNAKALGTSLAIFRCPEATGPENTTTYLAISGRNGCLIPSKPRPLAEITDAHSSTLIVLDAGEENAIPWMAPVDADGSLVMNLGPTSKLHHAGGTNAALVDGSVGFLKIGTPAAIRGALLSISGHDDALAREW
jgi:prepilin-type processing-associated H-X9-DG protein